MLSFDELHERFVCDANTAVEFKLIRSKEDIPADHDKIDVLRGQFDEERQVSDLEMSKGGKKGKFEHIFQD